MERNLQQPLLDHWALINFVIENTGYTDDAIRAKAHRGDWAAKAFCKTAPDGRLVFNFTRIQEWMCSLASPHARQGHWMLGAQLSKMTGYTAEAINAKVRVVRGVWTFDVHWTKAPDGRRVFNFTRIQEWMSSVD